MREILFRGKGDPSFNDGSWYNGYLGIDKDGDYVICGSSWSRTVIPETVGQYTGLKDKNGKKIFEGDVVRNRNKYFQFVGIVKYQNGQFMVDWKLHQRIADGVISSTVTHHIGNADEVIGNIYDNAELVNKD